MEKKYGRDLTEQEAWGMVEFIRMLLEHADNNLNKILAEQEKLKEEEKN